jgi:glycosyltransferase involved in cell wall biosynthesis
MQSGGGIQNKVLESMALGKVNLVSALAAAALKGLENGCCTGERVMYICRTPEEYVKRLLDMAVKRTAVSTFSEYETVGQAAREYIRRHYTWEKYGEAYLKGIEGER